MTSSELSPCPFCGNVYLLASEVHEVREQLRQWCDHCGTYGPPGDSEEEAQEAWNNRRFPEVDGPFIPKGFIAPWAGGSTPPPGWALCKGGGFIYKL